MSSGGVARFRLYAGTLAVAGIAAAVVAVPRPVCADQPLESGVVVRGDKAVSVHYRPSYGDLPAGAQARPVAAR